MLFFARQASRPYSYFPPNEPDTYCVSPSSPASPRKILHSIFIFLSPWPPKVSRRKIRLCGLPHHQMRGGQEVSFWLALPLPHLPESSSCTRALTALPLPIRHSQTLGPALTASLACGCTVPGRDRPSFDRKGAHDIQHANQHGSPTVLLCCKTFQLPAPVQPHTVASWR